MWGQQKKDVRISVLEKFIVWLGRKIKITQNITQVPKYLQ